MAAPTPSRTRPAPRRARLVLVVALAALVLVAGCAGYDALNDLSGDLEAEGFRDVTTEVSPTDASFVLVSASAPGGTSVEAAQDQAAGVVWTRFPRRFERLRVTVDDERQEWTYAELEDQLGARPSSLDVSTDIGDELTRMYVIIVLGVLAAGVVGVAVVGLIVFLAVRANRRSAAARPPVRPWMPPNVPVAPPGGWAPASAPPGPPGPADPTSSARPPAPWAPPGPWTTPSPDPTAPAGPWATPGQTAGGATDGPPDPAAPAGPPAAGGAGDGRPSLEKEPSASTPDAPSTAPEPTTWASPTGPPPPTAPGAAPTPSGATPSGATPAVPPGPPPPPGRRPKDPDARRLGRRPRGPVPDEAHTPPGWG